MVIETSAIPSFEKIVSSPWRNEAATAVIGILDKAAGMYQKGVNMLGGIPQRSAEFRDKISVGGIKGLIAGSIYIRDAVTAMAEAEKQELGITSDNRLLNAGMHALVGLYGALATGLMLIEPQLSVKLQEITLGTTDWPGISDSETGIGVKSDTIHYDPKSGYCEEGHFNSQGNFVDDRRK